MTYDHSGFVIDLVDLATLDLVDTIAIGSEVTSVTLGGDVLVVGCMRGVLALRLKMATASG
jgi:hypothetical protein